MASGLDIYDCVLSCSEGTANLHCYTNCTPTTLYCSKVSFLQCFHIKRYNKIFTKNVRGVLTSVRYCILTCIYIQYMFIYIFFIMLFTEFINSIFIINISLSAANLLQCIMGGHIIKSTTFWNSLYYCDFINVNIHKTCMHKISLGSIYLNKMNYGLLKHVFLSKSYNYVKLSTLSLIFFAKFLQCIMGGCIIKSPTFWNSYFIFCTPMRP